MTNTADSTKLLYPDLSFEIMKFIFEVHNQLGSGYTEEIYERALIIELEQNGIPFESQKCIEVMYKGQKIGVYRLDIVVDGKIVLELKAVKELTDVFRQQLLSYLKASGLRLGILVNFGAPRVQSIRIAA